MIKVVNMWFAFQNTKYFINIFDKLFIRRQ